MPGLADLNRKRWFVQTAAGFLGSLNMSAGPFDILAHNEWSAILIANVVNRDDVGVTAAAHGLASRTKRKHRPH
jgi:hypothetical protein